MAIYKVTDLKTDEATTRLDLNEEFEQNKLEDDTYETFVAELLESRRLQAQLGVTIETVDPLEAVQLTREEKEVAEVAAKTAKAELQRFTMLALHSIEDNEDTKTKVSTILGASKQAPTHILNWYNKKGSDKLPALSKKVKDELEREAKVRKDRRNSTGS